MNYATSPWEWVALLQFIDENLLLKPVKKIDESKITIEKESALYVFGENGERLPSNAIKGFEQLEQLWRSLRN